MGITYLPFCETCQEMDEFCNKGQVLLKAQNNEQKIHMTYNAALYILQH